MKDKLERIAKLRDEFESITKKDSTDIEIDFVVQIPFHQMLIEMSDESDEQEVDVNVNQLIQTCTFFEENECIQSFIQNELDDTFDGHVRLDKIIQIAGPAGGFPELNCVVDLPIMETMHLLKDVGYDDPAIHIDGVSDELVDLLLALDETDGSITTREVVEMFHRFINENKVECKRS